MGSDSVTVPGRGRSAAIALNRAVYRLSRDWVFWFLALTGLWVILPWLAPVFMNLGWEGPAQAIYWLYSFQCHQLPQRSFFLFGPQSMLSLERIQSLWQNTLDPRVLRQFIGTTEVGFKVAWSDRMVSAYSSIPLAAVIWWPLRKRLRALPLWGFALFSLPMFLDGLSHMVSDLAGIDQGFRTANAWLVELTSNRFPASFYVGNALGSFNSWMRLISGALFGIGAVWFALPHLDLSLRESATAIEAKFERAEVKL
ncbi:MAG TPA: DUF2085 domain-containing protein [Anaerolineales bacterium]